MASIFEKFSGFFGGPPWTSNPSKSRNLTRGFWGRGWGRKKFDPPYLPHLGVKGAKFIFSLGAPLGATLIPKTTGLAPTWAPPKIRDCFKKFWGVVPETGFLRGLPLSECRTNFFERLRRKKPQAFFSFFQISIQGLSYAPSKNGQIFDEFWPKIHAGLIWRREGLRWIKIQCLVGK